jgi:hypothetical protein
MVFKRAQGQGRIVHIDGLNEVRALCGKWLVADEILPVGSPRRDWKQTLISDGFLAFRHPDIRAVHTMMNAAIRDLRLYAAQ